MEQFMKYGPFQAIARFWESLTGTQKFVTTVFVATSIVLLMVVSTVATKPRMVVLFSGLDAGDAGEVVSKLQERQVPYEVDGSTIKVPEKRVAEVRMDLAKQGLPHGGNVGFEIFDRSSLGMTEFSQRLNYQRAIQGELARSIDQLDGVERSKVLIAIPDRRLFTKDEREPSASVVMKLRPGNGLGAEQVGGIVHLVSSAVEGMKPESVTVVDTAGNTLSEPGSESTGLASRLNASQLQLQRGHERQVEKDIQSMLERILGPNKSIVRVNAKINFDRTETNREIYEPAEAGAGVGVLSSQVRSQETYGGNRGPLAALTGDANEKPSSETGYQRVETTSKYEVSKTIERIVKAPGQVEKMSVAVMVDEDASAGKLVAIRNAVKTATGIEDSNLITVESIKFDDSVAKQQDKEMKALASRDTYVNVGKTAGAAVLVLVVLLLLKSMLSKVKLSVSQPAVAQELASNEVAMAPAYGPARPAANSGISGEMQQVKPEEVAQVLRKWISEG